MEQLFAPWRIEWIKRERDPIDGCPFCVLPEEADDRSNQIVARSEHSFVLLNNYPYNPGHVMVIPRQHTGKYTDLSETEVLDHALLQQRTLEAIESGMGSEGVNTGLNLGPAAGGSIGDHLHTHVVPRWRGDTNFMPVLSDTKVIVQALEETYTQLYAAFAALDEAIVPDVTDDETEPTAAVHFSFDL